MGNIGESLRDGDDDGDAREEDMVVDETFIARIDAQNSGSATSLEADSAALSVAPEPSSSVV